MTKSPLVKSKEKLLESITCVQSIEYMLKPTMNERELTHIKMIMRGCVQDMRAAVYEMRKIKV